MDLYKILDIDPSASTIDIKRAYRTLSMKYHPDKNTDDQTSDKMCDINRAYAILSDSKERQLYDHSSGMVNIDSDITAFMSRVFSHSNPSSYSTTNEDDLMNFLGSMAAQVANQYQHHTAVPSKPVPIITQLYLPLNKIFTGTVITMPVRRWIIDPITQEKQENTTDICITIPPGMRDGEIIMATGQGNIISDTNRGDVKIVIYAEPHPEFTRSGPNLIWKKSITLKEALCGFTIELPHLSGQTYPIRNTRNAIIHPGYIKTVPRMGFTRNGEPPGDLQIQFEVQFPVTLPEEVQGILQTVDF